MILELGFEASLLTSVAAWVLIGFTTGYGAHLVPTRLLDHDTWLTRPRAFEDGGRFYERRLAIRVWKDRLPEKGDLFPGGFSKRTITDRSEGFLGRFAAETRRAEIVHWLNAVSGPVFLIWCSWPLGVVMICFGWGGHLPFICIQRYNRARITRTLARRHRAAAPSSPPPAPAPSPVLVDLPDAATPTA
jgi:glycosyl-4,4'-diaponeurosporenoate acyltransferase